MLLTTGHIIGFGLLTVLWWWALATMQPARNALIEALVFSLVLGVMTEFAQATIPDRAASLFDLAVNIIATMATAWVIRRTGTPWRVESQSP